MNLLLGDVISLRGTVQTMWNGLTIVEDAIVECTVIAVDAHNHEVLVMNSKSNELRTVDAAMITTMTLLGCTSYARVDSHYSRSASRRRVDSFNTRLRLHDGQLGAVRT